MNKYINENKIIFISIHNISFELKIFKNIYKTFDKLIIL